MELKSYWKILRRRWWVVVFLTLLAGGLSYFLSPQAQAGYQATFRVLVSNAPEPRTGDYFTYDRYYNWVAAEYLVDDLAEVVKSQSFADQVRQEMGSGAAQGVAFTGAFRAQKVHRILTINISAPRGEDAQALASAAARVLEKQGPSYLTQLQGAKITVGIIDPPTVALAATGRSYLDLALRTGLGLLVGVALVFLLHYLDDRLYDKEEVERLLNLAVVGEIPPS